LFLGLYGGRESTCGVVGGGGCVFLVGVGSGVGSVMVGGSYKVRGIVLWGCCGGGGVTGPAR